MKLSRKVITVLFATLAILSEVVVLSTTSEPETKAATPKNHTPMTISFPRFIPTAIPAVSGTAVSGQSVEVLPEAVPLSKPMTLAEKYKDLKIKKVSYKAYSKKNLVIKQYPDKEAKKFKNKIKKWDSVKVIGKIKGKLGKKWIKVKHGKKKGYVDRKQLSKTCPDYLYKFNGAKLTKSKGVNAGPSGKETYYNLPMSGVVRIMRNHGNNSKYWVRSDGCKMLGKYIMIAADQRIRPLGSHIKTSLGMGIVCDTGTFIYSNSHQIDIAVAW